MAAYAAAVDQAEAMAAGAPAEPLRAWMDRWDATLAAAQAAEEAVSAEMQADMAAVPLHQMTAYVKEGARLRAAIDRHLAAMEQAWLDGKR
jgi:hypothetical protein